MWGCVCSGNQFSKYCFMLSLTCTVTIQTFETYSATNDMDPLFDPVSCLPYFAALEKMLEFDEFWEGFIHGNRLLEFEHAWSHLKKMKVGNLTTKKMSRQDAESKLKLWPQGLTDKTRGSLCGLVLVYYQLTLLVWPAACLLITLIPIATKWLLNARMTREAAWADGACNLTQLPNCCGSAKPVDPINITGWRCSLSSSPK